MSIFGYDINGTWLDRPIDIYMRMDTVSIKIMEQLGFRLSNVEQPVRVFIFSSNQDEFTKQDKKLGLDPQMVGMPRVDYIRQLAKRLPKIEFNIINSDTIPNIFLPTGAYYRYLNDGSSTILCLNTYNHEHYLEAYHNNEIYEHNNYMFKQAQSSQFKRVFNISYGINDAGESRVQLGFNGNLGRFEGYTEQVGTEATEFKQMNDLRMMVGMMVNNLLTGRRFHNIGLTVRDGLIIREGYEPLEVTLLHQFGMVNHLEQYTQYNTILQNIELPLPVRDETEDKKRFIQEFTLDKIRKLTDDYGIDSQDVRFLDALKLSYTRLNVEDDSLNAEEQLKLFEFVKRIESDYELSQLY